MKRTLSGEIKVIGFYPVAGGKRLYVLPFDAAEYWEVKKKRCAIALCWQGKLYFRQIYCRKDEYCFKFFNHVIYLSEIERTEGTHDYIVYE